MSDEPWFINQELRWLRAAEAEQLQLDVLQRELAPHRDLAYVGLSKRPDGIETIYVARWKNPRKGEDPLVKIYGRSRPMTKVELGEHLRQQIEEAIARRKRPNRKFVAQREVSDSSESRAFGTEVPGGALVRIAEEMSLNAAGLMRRDATEATGGVLAAIGSHGRER
jgi:hypothetical protein